MRFRSPKNAEVTAASNRLPGDSDLHDLTKYLTGELYETDPSVRDQYYWRMNQDWLDYCRDTLAGIWDVQRPCTHLYGKEIVVDEAYGIPKMVKR